MTILVLGINHKTAPVSLREKVDFSEEKSLLALQHLAQSELAPFAVILSTCNRTELYLHNKNIAPKNSQLWLQDMMKWLAEFHSIELKELQDCLYSQHNQLAVHHIMRVACGLDSLVLGEPQILGQVKQAFQRSEQFYQQQSFPLSSELSRLFQKTFATAKRVRTETNIGENAVSVAYAACCLARDLFDSLKELNILMIGAGETIELASRHLLRHGVKQLLIANRTQARAENLLQKLGATELAKALSLTELGEALAQADIVMSSTGSSHILVSQDMVAEAQRLRQNRPLLMIDIAVPRDIEASVAQLENVHHYTVDDLQHIIQQNLSQREQASQQAEQIIQQECEDYFEWLKVHQFSNLIRTYRQNAELMCQELLNKSLLSLQQGLAAEQVLQELSYKLTNKLLHTPTLVMQDMVKVSNTSGLQSFSQALGVEDENEELS